MMSSLDAIPRVISRTTHTLDVITSISRYDRRSNWLHFLYYKLLVAQGCRNFPKIEAPPENKDTGNVTWGHYYTGNPETSRDAVKSVVPPALCPTGFCGRLSLEFVHIGTTGIDLSSFRKLIVTKFTMNRDHFNLQRWYLSAHAHGLSLLKAELCNGMLEPARDMGFSWPVDGTQIADLYRNCSDTG